MSNSAEIPSFQNPPAPPGSESLQPPNSVNQIRRILVTHIPLVAAFAFAALAVTISLIWANSTRNAQEESHHQEIFMMETKHDNELTALNDSIGSLRNDKLSLNGTIKEMAQYIKVLEADIVRRKHDSEEMLRDISEIENITRRIYRRGELNTQ